MSSHGFQAGWRWVERPEYASQCEALASQKFDIDRVKWAIEENILRNPILGSAPSFPPDHPRHNPDERRVFFEAAPELGVDEALVVIFRLGPIPGDGSLRQVIGWAIFRESELA